jgi:hypothetical protein
MQTVLLAREIARMMRWDGDSKRAVNLHFASVTELNRTMGYIGNLSIEDVLKCVLLATLKDSANSSLRAAYHKAQSPTRNWRVPRPDGYPRVLSTNMLPQTKVCVPG